MHLHFFIYILEISFVFILKIFFFTGKTCSLSVIIVEVCLVEISSEKKVCLEKKEIPPCQ